MANDRRECILVAVEILINNMIPQRALACEIHSRIQTELQNRFYPSDSNEFRASVTTEAVSLVDSMLLASGYDLGLPPAGNSVHHAIEAQLPLEEQVQEAAEAGLQEALEVETPLIPQHALTVAPTADVQQAVTVRQEGDIPYNPPEN